MWEKTLYTFLLILRAWTNETTQAVRQRDNDLFKHFTWCLSIFTTALTPPADFNFAYRTLYRTEISLRGKRFLARFV